MGKRIYLADDEKNIRLLMKTFLENEGYEVEAFSNGQELKNALANAVPDLVILDIMMPGEDGLSICTQIRKRSNVPIIIVSAKDSPLDRVNGIVLGSDDYIVKPFLPLELTARVRALFRRVDALQGETNGETNGRKKWSVGDLVLDQETHKVFYKQEELVVTPTEYKFLQFLMERFPAAVRKEDVLRSVWNTDDVADARMIDDLLKRLRKKLRENGTVRIETVWGYGYRMVEK